MSKPQDGFVSRFLNRPISCRITRVLIKFPIHPNAWTISSFVLPVVASLFLMRGEYVSVLIGAALFQVFSVVDGCDGEIARAKGLESKFGERLDSFCDFLASLLYVLALGWGLNHRIEGIACAALIAIHELLVRYSEGGTSVDSPSLDEAFYERHHGMIENSGLLGLGKRSVWLIFQLTKRDMAVFAFLILAILGLANWILHLWTAVAAASVILSAIAAVRSAFGRSEVVPGEPRFDATLGQE